MVIEQIKALERQREEAIQRAKEGLPPPLTPWEREEIERRDRFIRLVEESGVREEMERIRAELLKDVKGVILVSCSGGGDYDRELENKLILAWGKYPPKQEMNDRGRYYKTGGSDYYYIEAAFDRYRDLKITAGKMYDPHAFGYYTYVRTVQEHTWRGNRNALRDVLAEAYLNPKWYQSPESGLGGGGTYGSDGWPNPPGSR